MQRPPTVGLSVHESNVKKRGGDLREGEGNKKRKIKKKKEQKERKQRKKEKGREGEKEQLVGEDVSSARGV